MKKLHVAMAILLFLPAYHVNARCHWAYAGRYEVTEGAIIDKDYMDILFVVNNASDKWMYLWMGHPGYGEDNGNLNLKPHSSATALGCSNGAGYAVTGIILTQGKDVLYTFDVDKSRYSNGYVSMHTWKGGCYVAYDRRDSTRDHTDHWPLHWNMSKMAPKECWDTHEARVRIDCV